MHSHIMYVYLCINIFISSYVLASSDMLARIYLTFSNTVHHMLPDTYIHIFVYKCVFVHMHSAYIR